MRRQRFFRYRVRLAGSVAALTSGMLLGACNEPDTPVGPPPAPQQSVDFFGTVYFHSDWSTGVGAGDDAVHDTNKAKPWTEHDLTAGVEVVTAASTGLSGWPSTNVLKVPNDGKALQFHRSDGYLPPMDVGETLFVRHYRSIEFGDAGGENEHGFYFDDEPSGLNWGPNIAGYSDHQHASNAALYWHRLSGTQVGEPTPGGGSGNRYYGPPVSLSRNTVYRYETKITRTGTLTHTMAHRVYDASDVLLYDSADDGEIISLDHGPPGEDLHDRVFEVDNANRFLSMEGLRIGQEGVNGTGSIGQYNAAVAICSTWCGPYPIQGVEGSGGSGSSPLAVHCFSAWHGSTGTSLYAVRDSANASRCWETSDPLPTAFTVKNSAANSRSFPTTNYLEFKATTTETSGLLQLGDPTATGASSKIPKLEPGDSIVYRYYFSFRRDSASIATDPTPDTHGDEPLVFQQPYTHGIYPTAASASIRWDLKTLNTSDSVFSNGPFRHNSEYCPDPGGDGAQFHADSVYRIESGVTRVVGAQNRYKGLARIYIRRGGTDVLLFDVGGFTMRCFLGAGGAAHTLLTDTLQHADTTIWDPDLRRFEIGINGLGGDAAQHNNKIIHEWAAYAICAGWCGAYPISGVEPAP